MKHIISCSAVLVNCLCLRYHVCVHGGRRAIRKLKRIASIKKNKSVIFPKYCWSWLPLCFFMWTFQWFLGGEQRHPHSRIKCSYYNISVKLFLLLLVLYATWSCDTGLWVTNVSFLKGSIGSCESRRQEAVHVSDNHVEWTMLQIVMGKPTRMPSLTGRPCRNWPQMQTHAMRSTTKQNSQIRSSDILFPSSFFPPSWLFLWVSWKTRRRCIYKNGHARACVYVCANACETEESLKLGLLKSSPCSCLTAIIFRLKELK